MGEAILSLEPVIRVSAFTGMLCLMALLEAASPRRRREVSRLIRWTNNLALVVLDNFILRLVFPMLAVSMALIAAERGWGLFNIIGLPAWLAGLAAIVLLDLAVYAQHVMFHATPALWRLHRMHHADLDFDVTTALRFHPLEIILSMLIKLAVVVLLGAPAIAVMIFEVLLNATAMFNHANLRLPAAVDRTLGFFIVTPDMHRVHHSIRREETNSNYGFNLPVWDRLFGTYRAEPRDGHEGMTIGIEEFRSHRDLWLDRLLMQPFRGAAHGKVPESGNPSAGSADPAQIAFKPRVAP